jgi:hypothetical protein
MALDKKAVIFVVALVMLLAAASYLINTYSSNILPSNFPKSMPNAGLDENTYIPEVSFEGWQSSEILDNPENCEDFFVGVGLLGYCNLSGVQSAYSKVWKPRDSNISPLEWISLNRFVQKNDGAENVRMKNVLSSLKSIPDEKTKEEYTRYGVKIARYSQINYIKKVPGNLSPEEIESLKYNFSSELFAEHVIYLYGFEKNGGVYLLRCRDSDESKAQQIIEATLKL